MKPTPFILRLSTRSSLAFIFVLTIMVSIITLSCSSGNGTTQSTSTTTSHATTTSSVVSTGTQATSNTAASISAPYSISIMMNNQQIASLALADLSKLPQVTDAAQETGPTLLSVLNSVGIQNFSQVTINGSNQGRTTSATTTLQKAQITANVMLALVSRGTAKLTGSDVTTQIIDVRQIIVQ